MKPTILQRIVSIPLLFLGIGAISFLLFFLVMGGWYISPEVFLLTILIVLPYMYHKFSVSQIKLNIAQKIIMSFVLLVQTLLLVFYILLIFGLLLVLLYPDVYQSDHLGFVVTLVLAPLAILATYRTVQILLGDNYSYKWFLKSIFLYVLTGLVFEAGSSGSHKYLMFDGGDIFDLYKSIPFVVIFSIFVSFQIWFIGSIKSSSPVSVQNKYLAHGQFPTKKVISVLVSVSVLLIAYWFFVNLTAESTTCCPTLDIPVDFEKNIPI